VAKTHFLKYLYVIEKIYILKINKIGDSFDQENLGGDFYV